MVTVGFMGYGYWGPNILRTLHNCKDIKIVLACDVNPANLVRMRKDFPHVPITQHPGKIFSSQDINAIFLATPAETHFDLAKRAMENGKHVFVEKPLACSSGDAKDLTVIATQKNKKLMVGHVFTFHPAVRYLKHAIETGVLGKVHFGYAQRTSLGPRVRSDVNIIWDYAIHDIYIAMHLFGGKPKWVTATGKDALQTGIEDVVFITLQFKSGVTYHIHSSWYDPLKVRSMTLIGSERMVTYDDMKPEKVTLFKRGYAPHQGMDNYGNKNLRLFDEGIEIPAIPNQQPLQIEIEHFIDCIQNDKQILTDGLVGIWTLEVIEAVNKSLKSDGPVFM